MTEFIEKNSKLLLGIAIIIIILGSIKMVDQIAENIQHNKSYKAVQKELDDLKKLREREIKLRKDTILQLTKDKEVLYDSIQVVKIKLKQKEDEKIKVIRVVQSMSISDQQSYFAERYSKGSSPRQYNSSVSHNGLRDGGHLLRADETATPTDNYFGKRYS